MGTALDILKTFEKECFKGEKKKIIITVREIHKDLQDIKIKEEDKSGNLQIRVHTNDDKSPPWYVHAFAFPLSNLSIDDVEDKNRVADILDTLDGIKDAETKTTLKKIIKDYGEIKNDGSRNKLSFKTERFKKQKDYMRVKRKTL
jgi:hypothetical protein